MLREGLTAAAATQPQAAPAPAGHREASCKDCEASCKETTDFLSTTLLVGIDDNRQPTYKAKGGQYAKFGVRIWPEVLPALGIDPASLKPGPNPVNLKVNVLMGENGPRKVISLAK